MFHSQQTYVFCSFFCNHFIWFRDCCAPQSNNTSMRYGKHRNIIYQKYASFRPPSPLLPATIFLEIPLKPTTSFVTVPYMCWFRRAASSSQVPSVVVGKHSILC